MRTYPGGENILEKLTRLMKTAGISKIDMKNKYVAIKLHFGEYGNIAYLRPQFVRTVAEMVKSLGGKPFATDCSTLYVGGRYDALSHLQTAELDGFNSTTCGCPVLIADGLRGNDQMEVPVRGGELVKTAHIGRALYDADIIIALTHFKGHEGAGFGGSLKNIGMGGGSQEGKRDMHSGGCPQVVSSKCVGCRVCATQCQQKAISFTNNVAEIDNGKCAGCGRCIGVCRAGAIDHLEADANVSLNKKIAEYTLAIVDGKPNFNINIIMDVSPYCDCHGENDTPVIPDVGMLASFDPVAIDAASAELCNQQTPIAHTHLTDMHNDHHDHFTHMHPETNWTTQISHGEKLGLGSGEYKLIVVK
jgi:uncharacterized Fe-S center protein